MSRSLVEDAFAHHVWATLRLIDACLALSAEQLQTAVPGTYGSILGTTRHLVAGDASYLRALTGEATPVVDEQDLDLRGLRGAMQARGTAWSRLLAEDLDPDTVVVERSSDQICTTLTALGVDPPDIDGWEFGMQDGLIVESAPWLTR